MHIPAERRVAGSLARFEEICFTGNKSLPIV
jgi:hypothetical protein